jgi:hypothetical protein
MDEIEEVAKPNEDDASDEMNPSQKHEEVRLEILRKGNLGGHRHNPFEEIMCRNCTGKPPERAKAGVIFNGRGFLATDRKKQVPPHLASEACRNGNTFGDLLIFEESRKI